MYQIQSTYNLEGFLETRIGGRAENQDSCGFSDTPIGALIVVCDGMGGMNGGSMASSLAVQTIIDIVSSSRAESDPVEVISEAIEKANSAIFQTGQNTPSLLGMGTTLTLLLINDYCAYVSYVGDSRVYQLRAGKKIFRTFDDSVVFQLVRSGAISEEEARVAGNSNVITKALGIKETVDFEVKQLPYDIKDRFLLCTDGFWGTLPEDRLLSFIGQKDEISIVLERTFNKVENAGKDTHPNHYDNLTAAFLEVNRQSKLRSTMERKYKLLSCCLAILLVVSLCALGITYFGDPIHKAAKLQAEAVKAQNKADSLQAVLVKIESIFNKSRDNLDLFKSRNQQVGQDSTGDGASKQTDKVLKELEKNLKEAEEKMTDTKAKVADAISQADRAKEKASKAIEKIRDRLSDIDGSNTVKENE